jgi:hypothetical protein
LVGQIGLEISTWYVAWHLRFEEFYTFSSSLSDLKTTCGNIAYKLDVNSRKRNARQGRVRFQPPSGIMVVPTNDVVWSPCGGTLPIWRT